MTPTERDLREALAGDVQHLSGGGGLVQQVHARIRHSRRRRWLAASSALVVAAATAVAIGLTVPGSGGRASVTPAAPTTGAVAPVSPALAADLAGIPASAYATVGVSRAAPSTAPGSRVTGLMNIQGGSPILVDGKPAFVFIAGEFCPYCAAERWAVVAALARFGTFNGLQTTQSSGVDVYPNTATLTFRTTTYDSPYLSAQLYEIEDGAGKPLQTPSPAAAAAFRMYDPNSGIPFLSISNRYLGTTQFSPQVLKGMTADQIGAALEDPTSTVAQQTLTAANILTAGICVSTDQQPVDVCYAPEVKAAAAYLGADGNQPGQ